MSGFYLHQVTLYAKDIPNSINFYKGCFLPVVPVPFLGQSEYAKFDGNVYIFSLRPKIPFLGIFGSKSLYIMLKMKLRSCTNLNTLNSMVMSTFLV